MRLEGFVADVTLLGLLHRLLAGLEVTAWSAAALVSPPLAARMRETYGSYSAVLSVCVVISGFGLLRPWLVLYPRPLLRIGGDHFR